MSAGKIAQVTAGVPCPIRGQAGAGATPTTGFSTIRQVDHRGQYAEQDREPPAELEGPRAHECDTAEPDPEKAADLVTEKRQPGERREPARAEYQRNDPIRGRDRGEPQQAHDRAKEDRRERRDRKNDENEDRGGTREINERQEVALGHEGAEPAPGHRADDVAEPDRRDGP